MIMHCDHSHQRKETLFQNARLLTPRKRALFQFPSHATITLEPRQHFTLPAGCRPLLAAVQVLTKAKRCHISFPGWPTFHAGHSRCCDPHRNEPCLRSRPGMCPHTLTPPTITTHRFLLTQLRSQSRLRTTVELSRLFRSFCICICIPISLPISLPTLWLSLRPINLFFLPSTKFVI